MRRLVPMLALALSCAAPPPPPSAPAELPAKASEAEEVPRSRLPTDVRPVHYVPSLTIDPREPTFSGTVSIRIDLDRARDVLWLHGNGLEATKATVTTLGGEALEARYEQVDPSGVVKLSLPRMVGPGVARIEIAFRGPFEKRLDGLY